MHRTAARLITAAAAAALVACGPGDRHQSASPPSVSAPGEALFAQGMFDSARAAWRAALAEAGVAGTHDEARLLTWLGLAAFRLGEYPEARRQGEAALALKQRLGMSTELARSYNALGLLAWREGRLDDAAELFAHALDGYRAARDAAGFARASHNLGLVRYDLGRFDDARAAWQLAIDTARWLDSARIEGRSLANLAMLEIWAGDPMRAPELLALARARAEAAGDAPGLANAVGQLGVAYRVLGEPGRALAALDSALAAVRELGMRDEEADNLLVMASIYADAGDPDQALRVYAQARRIQHELGLPIEEGSVLRLEAVLRAARGALDAAYRDVHDALALHRTAGARHEEFHDLLVMADIERRMQRQEAAQRTIREAQALADELGSAQARVKLALVDARIADDAGEHTRALRALDGARAELAYAGAAAEAEAHALALRAWSALSELDSAVVAGRSAIDAMDRIRDGFAAAPLRTSYIADRSHVYADLVIALLRQGETEDAFAVADAARGRAIIEHLSAARGSAARGVGVADLAEAEGLLRRIDQLVALLARDARDVPPHERGAEYAAIERELLAHLEQARSEYRALRVRAAERDPARSGLLGARTLPARALRSALEGREALLAYLVTAERLFIFVATPDSVGVVVHDIGHEELAHRVQLARELLTSLEAHERARPVTEALHELLVAPARAAGALEDVRHLIIVPHGPLTYLPFAALRDERTGRILADDFAVSHLPAATALTMLRPRAPREVAALAGASVFAPFPDRLPATAAEARAVQHVMPRATSVTGRRASEAAVRRALAADGIVHIASHGVMNARNPLFSRIELARGRGGPADDGRLEVHEVLDLEVASPLVFLSGCQTALGGAWSTAFDQGEDYATLAQAFLFAGASSVLATLWRIDDAGAAAFAERFYHHLRTQPPAFALAAAQRDLRAEPRWIRPYYWAAYTLSGAGANGLDGRVTRASSPAAAQIGAALTVQHH